MICFVFSFVLFFLCFHPLLYSFQIYPHHLNSLIEKGRYHHLSKPIVTSHKVLNQHRISMKYSFDLKSAASWSSIIESGLSLLTQGPSIAKEVSVSIHPADIIFFLFFYLTYKKSLRIAHKGQKYLWKFLSLGSPYEWEKSVLGFLEERCGLLMRLIGCNYMISIVVIILGKMGLRFRNDFPQLLARVSYALYATNFVDMFKSKFLHTFWPKLSDNRRQSYVVNRSSSVVIWMIGVIIASEMVSTYLKVPLSSTLAFGGFGGLALGLSARDIAANFLGGLLLLFNEPFTPGDMVTFRTGNTELLGRVERVGWGQTRIRGRDTRSTYVPNSHFVQTPVTNMERITHRKFETIIPLRYQDYKAITDVVAKIKEGLRTIPKLDILSQPFRVSFIKVNQYSLDIEVTCYFATKSIDEFLTLQQMANLEIIKAVHDCGAALALPTSNFQIIQGPYNQPQPQQLPTQQPPQQPQHQSTQSQSQPQPQQQQQGMHHSQPIHTDTTSTASTIMVNPSIMLAPSSQSSTQSNNPLSGSSTNIPTLNPINPTNSENM